MEPLKVGVIGCGNILNKQYAEKARQYPVIDLVACADLDPQRAKDAAEMHNIPNACAVDELIKDDQIDVVLNLTVPAAHVEIGLRAIEAGKHVFNEKPLGITVAEGRKLLDAAKKKGVRVGCAPDTFLGTANQTARAVLDSGAIGRPVAAVAQFLSRGPEPWHPNPHFFYQPGGGPMLDMGPYFLTALINLLGPIKRVCGIAGVEIPDRVVGKGDHAGEQIPVHTPDHVAGTVEFTSGAIATLVTSWSVKPGAHENKHPISLYGTEGSMKVGNPNNFEIAPQVRRADEEDWQEQPVEHDHPNGRSLGLAEMCSAIRAERAHRATGDMAFAVLQAMEGILASSDRGEHVTVNGPADRPEPMPAGLGTDGALEPSAARSA